MKAVKSNFLIRGHKFITKTTRLSGYDKYCSSDFNLFFDKMICT